jgi:hypothetical protein
MFQTSAADLTTGRQRKPIRATGGGCTQLHSVQPITCLDGRTTLSARHYPRPRESKPQEA